jgi:hypothetical protein
MSDRIIKEIHRGKVECRSGEIISIDYCRFCVHSKAFIEKGREIPSPARIYCLAHKPSKEAIDFATVEAVICEDNKREGYRSMMNIIG